MAYTSTPMPNYYLHRDGESQGPYAQNDMHGMIVTGQVKGEELICREGESDWVPASTLVKPTAPRATMLGHSQSHSAAVSTLEQQKVTREQVSEAFSKLRMPVLGILFSAAVPLILWAAKSDVERGIQNPDTKVARETTDLLPLAIAVGLIGVVFFIIWFRKERRRAKMIKASYDHQQG